MRALGTVPQGLERDSARLLRSVLNSHPLILWALDKKGVFTLSEGKGLATLGFKPGEVVGRSVFEIYKGHAEIVRSIRRALRGENIRLSLDIGSASFDCTYYPVRDSNGRPAGMFGVATEITELRRAQETLRHLQEEQREILDSVPAMIYYKDAGNRILRANRQAARSRGLSVEQIEGRTTESLFPNEARKYYMDDLEVIRSGRAKHGIIEPYSPREGVVRWVRTDKIPYRDRNGRVIGVIVFAQDITESLRADEEVRRKADLLGLLQSVTSAANLSKTSDEAMRITIEKVCALTGWPVGHVHRVPNYGDGRLVSTRLWHLTRPQGRFARFLRATEATALPRGVGLPGRVWKTGRPIWVVDARKDPATDARTRAAKACGIRSGFACPVMVKDEVAAVLEFFSDTPMVPEPELTAVMANIGAQLGRTLERERAEGVLRRSEELLRHLVAGVRDYALYRLDPNGRIASWNEGAARIKGYVAEEVVGRPMSIFYTPEDRARRTPQADLAAAASEGRSEREGWRIRKDGSRFWANVIITALRDDAGALRGFTHVTRDITERKRLEREILEVGAREQARIGQDLHDSLGQNLTGIALLANALRNRLAKRGAEESAEAAKVAAFASSAVQQAKDLARGLIPPELQAQGLAGGLVALASAAGELFGIECSVRCPKEFSGPGSLAALHMYRIAQEAIHNAAKHGRAKKVRLTLSWARGRMTLTVTDDGIGIPPAGRRKGGMGLGIMQYRARMMGASLDVGPGPKGGTSVICSIPLEDE